MIDPTEYVFKETLNVKDLTTDIEATILEMKLVSTKYGDKRVAVLDIEKQIFMNPNSLTTLVEAFGENEQGWIGKKIKISTETYGKDNLSKKMIVSPIVTKEEKVE